jgi:hypothetical protein
MISKEMINEKVEELIQNCEAFEAFDFDDYDEDPTNTCVDEYENCRICARYQFSRESCHDSLYYIAEEMLDN